MQLKQVLCITIIIASNNMFGFAVVYTLFSAQLKVIYIVHLFNHHENFLVDINLAIEAIKVGVATSITGYFPKPIPNISFIDYNRFTRFHLCTTFNLNYNDLDTYSKIGIVHCKYILFYKKFPYEMNHNH